MSTQKSCFTASAAMASRSAALSTPPVGFWGELMISSLVLSLASALSSSMSKEKSFSSASFRGMGLASRKLITDS